MPAKKKNTRKSATPKTAPEKSTAKKISEEQIKALTHRPKHTPALFKIPNKKQTPVVFSLDDVRELLSKRGTEKSTEPEPKKTAKKKAADVTKVEKSEPVQDKRKHSRASLDDILGISSAPAKPKYVIGKGPVPQKWEKMHAELMEMRRIVLDGMNMHSRGTLKRSSKDDSGDLSNLSSHMADNGTDTFERDFALSLLSSEQEALSEIESAIRRIYDGSYGICEVTGEEINIERLEAVPFTRFSLAGQQQNEKTSRRREKRVGAFLDSGDSNGFSDLEEEE